MSSDRREVGVGSVLCHQEAAKGLNSRSPTVLTPHITFLPAQMHPGLQVRMKNQT